MLTTTQLISLLNTWANHHKPAQFRDQLVSLAREKGFKSTQVGEFIQSVFSQNSSTEVTVPSPTSQMNGRGLTKKIIDTSGRGWVHPLSLEMVQEGYFGDTLNSPENAKKYIIMAADNPDVEDELPEDGWRFWKAAEFDFRYWKSRRNLNLG